MAKTLAALSLLAALAAAQEEKKEPPYRLDIERVALEKHGDEMQLSLRATSNLPRETTLDFSLSLVVERYDNTKHVLVRQPTDAPVLRKIRAEGGSGSRVEFATSEPFPREGEVRIEASFRPDRLFDPEREPIRKSMGEKFVPMKWEKSMTLGTPASRLGAVATSYPAFLARIAEVEKLVRRLDQLSGAKEEAIAEVCEEVNALRTKVEHAIAESPLSAGTEFLWQILGDVASWGAYKAILAASAKKGKNAAVADPDGGGKKPPPKDAPSFEKYNAEMFHKALERAKEIAVREYALAGVGEVVRLHNEAARALRSEKPAKLPVDAVRNAVQKHHHAGLSKVGEAYARLFAGPANEFFEGEIKKLDLLPGATAEELEKNVKELGTLMTPWRSFEK